MGYINIYTYIIHKKIISTMVCKKIVFIKANKLFWTGCPKSAMRGSKTIFFYRGIRKKILGKVTNFQV